MIKDNLVPKKYGEPRLRKQRQQADEGFTNFQEPQRLKKREFGLRLKQSLKTAGEREGVKTTLGLAERLKVDQKTLERWYAGAHVPDTERLYAIAQITGDSLDWIFGFSEVPQRRADRSVAAEAGDALRTAIEKIATEFQTFESLNTRSSNQGAESSQVRFPNWHKRIDPLPSSSSDLVQLLATAWWNRQIMELGSRWRDTLRELATRMRSDSRDETLDPQARGLLSDRSEQLHRDASSLDSVESIIGKLEQLEDQAQLTAESNFYVRKRGEPAFRTSFPVLAPALGYGLAWHGPKHDNLWCINTELRVIVKRKGWFLVEIE